METIHALKLKFSFFMNHKILPNQKEGAMQQVYSLVNLACVPRPRF